MECALTQERNTFTRIPLIIRHNRMENAIPLKDWVARSVNEHAPGASTPDAAVQDGSTNAHRLAHSLNSNDRKCKTMKLTGQTTRALEVSRLTVQAMRTPAVVVVDSGKVDNLRARIAELEQQVTAAEVKAQKLQARAKAQAKAQRTKAKRAKEQDQERINRAARLEEATIKAGGRSYAPEHEVPMLSMMGLTRPTAAIGSRKPGWMQRLMFWRK